MNDNKILQVVLDRLPQGRAFQNPLMQAFITGSQQIYIDIIKDIEKNADVSNNIVANYDNWLELLIRLPHTTDPEKQVANVLMKLATAGAMSLEYMQTQLRSAGFNVTVSSNYPAQNPFTYYNKSVNMLVENEPDAVEGNPNAYLRDKATIDFIVNYIDNRDDIYNNQYFITNNPNTWHNCFFIHGNDGIDSAAMIDKTQRDKFRELVIELKDLQSWGLAYVFYN